MRAHKLLPLIVVVLTLRVKIVIRRRWGRGPVRRRAGSHPPGGAVNSSVQAMQSPDGLSAAALG